MANGQGQYPDPAIPGTEPPAQETLSPRWLRALGSPTMESLRDALLQEGESDVRASILADLRAYTGLTEAECVDRCVHWEQHSIAEWAAGDRSTPEGITDFYNSIQSWNFELSWYAYLTTLGFVYPANVVIVERIRELGLFHDGATALDFGAGVGVTGQLLSRLGFRTTISDISKPLLAFSRFRIERRGEKLGYLDLNDEKLPVDAYDVITAVDTLVHVADLDETLEALHAALKPGGVLYGNYDVRAPSDGSDGNAWHLYNDAGALELKMFKHGFVCRTLLEGTFREYVRVDPTSLSHRLKYAVRLATRRVRKTLAPVKRALKR